MANYGKPAQAGVTFSATVKNSSYVARNDHQHWATAQRNRWATSCLPECQYSIFLDAQNNGWRDSRPQLWGLRAHLPVLGTNRQRLAKFPEPQNLIDPWHGYPISSQDENAPGVHVPERSLLNRWVEAGLISEVDRSRIQRRKV